MAIIESNIVELHTTLAPSGTLSVPLLCPAATLSHHLVYIHDMRLAARFARHHNVPYSLRTSQAATADCRFNCTTLRLMLLMAKTAACAWPQALYSERSTAAGHA